MPRLLENLDRTEFLPLPVPDGPGGDPRACGVEFEFTGLTEAQTAEVVVRTLGGTASSERDHQIDVAGGELGDIEILLDTAYRDRKGPIAELGLELGRQVIPVEIVTAPIPPADLPRLDTLVSALRTAGARGTRDGILYGFGVHLNVALASDEIAALRPISVAYALAEPWLRAADPLDTSRRILPFVDPWPDAFVDALCDGQGQDYPAFARLYLQEVASRNHGLDLMPILAHFEPDLLAEDEADFGAVKGRPAFHYRLPDCRIDEEDWSLAYEWNRWGLVERIAGDADLMSALVSAWRDHRAAYAIARENWADVVDRHISQSGIGKAFA